MSTEFQRPTFEDIQAASIRLTDVIEHTPLKLSKTFSGLSKNNVYLKLENLQTTGSFKIRGAFNKIANLTEEERKRGVIAASAGNHAQGVAHAARYHNSPCTIVMPATASLAKVAATQQYGATVVLHGDTYDDAYTHAVSLQQEFGYTFVHAFDDPYIVAGQGTAGLEIMQQLPDVDAIVIPMGGGGLAAGIALAVKTQKPQVKIIGVEAASFASFRHALDVGRIETITPGVTIADGIAVRRPGNLTYELAKEYIDDIITVEDDEIARAMVLLLERTKMVVEGAGATALAPVIYNRIPANLGNVVVVLSGGNIDVTMLSKIIEHGLIEAGRYLRLAVNLMDKPGALRNLLDIFANLGANVLSIQHRRVGVNISLGETEVEVDLETKDAKHIRTILEALGERGYLPTVRH